ncbi:MAG: hypothetical protein MUF07_12900 [Steroidobacteraceae bacterium]|jgi:hypothetical protein|nr:hypothetical protein [Steroidobacteraceae bacterium]
MRTTNAPQFSDRRRVRHCLAATLAIAAGGAAAQQQATPASSPSSAAQQRSTGASATVEAAAPFWLLVPVELSARSEQVADGCWVRLYSGDDFQGRVMTVVGPANLAEVRSPYGTGLNNWESAVVGPNATVTTYDDENFRARSATLRPGQRYAELDDSKLGLFEDIESMRVSCAAPSSASAGSSGSGAFSPAVPDNQGASGAAIAGAEDDSRPASTQHGSAIQDRGTGSVSAPADRDGSSGSSNGSAGATREPGASTTPSQATQSPGATSAPGNSTTASPNLAPAAQPAQQGWSSSGTDPAR